MTRSARHRMRAYFLAITWLIGCIFSSPAAARAQGTRIEGTARDPSGGAIANARVELHAKAIAEVTTTNQSGSFSFDKVTATSGTLVITAKGFQEVQRGWTALSSPVRIDVVLQPLPLTQRVMVTATRTETPLGETPVSDIQLTRADLRATPNLTLDDALRQVPGFSLFRRSSSRTANPTTMGVSLRGLGASGASRALVLEDGIPLNDPFGSWIYWDRVPRESVASIEVAQEGASSLYGSDALGGVIQFLTRSAYPAGISVETSYGNQNTSNFSAWAGGHAGPWESTLAASVFNTDGYIVVPKSERGPVDTRAGSGHQTVDLKIGHKIGAQNEIFARGWYLHDARNNGTQEQTNSIRLGQGALGANLQLRSAGTLTLRFYGTFETYHQTFSAVHFDQSSETLVNQQTVPAQGVGGSAVWSRTVGNRQTLVAGFDEHEEIGHSNEDKFSAISPGTHTVDTFAGGHQRTTGLFGEDIIQIGPKWLLSVSARWDHWRNFDGFDVVQSVTADGSPTGSPTVTSYTDRGYDAFSPRATLIHQMNSHVSWSASIYRAFRAPTLNELYRGFRVGNTTTHPNPDLRAERLTGGEAGVDVTTFARHLEVRGVYFYNQIIDPIANVPLSSPPNTKQRQNLGRTSAPGFEIDAIGKITGRLQLSGGYQYVDAKIISAPGQPDLLGTWVEEVPHNVLTFQARYSNPSQISFTVDGRLIGQQLDTTGFYLGRFFVLDAMVSRPIGHGVDAFAAAENLFNEQYYLAALNPGVSPAHLGLPIAARFGLRYTFPKR